MYVGGRTAVYRKVDVVYIEREGEKERLKRTTRFSQKAYMLISRRMAPENRARADREEKGVVLTATEMGNQEVEEMDGEDIEGLLDFPKEI